MSWRLRRLQRPGVEHIELWCAATPRGPLWQHLGSDPVAARLAVGEPPERVGCDLGSLTGGPLGALARERAVSRIWLGGGLTGLPGFGAALEESIGRPVHVSGDGRFSGERGGGALLAAELGATGAVVDVGQTAVKASGGGQRLLVERDRETLPLIYIDPGRPPEPDPARRRAAVELIAGAASAALAVSAPLDAAGRGALVLALPGPIGAEPVPGPCTYGWEGDRELVPGLLAALEALRPGGGEILLLNDAELAAESARAELGPGAGERLLCVTLGFGPGAALLSEPD